MLSVSILPTSRQFLAEQEPVRRAWSLPVGDSSNAFSIFHEPWWLDITAGGCWHVARCVRNGRVLAEMTYLDTRRGIWRVSGLPMLTRTLGPVDFLDEAKPVEQARNRLSVLEELIDQLPSFHRFYQSFDPRIKDALAFQIRGFELKQSYTYRIAAERTAEEVWKGMRYQTRNSIRSAFSHVSVRTIEEPAEFVAFYGKSQEERKRGNMYSPEAMERLAEACLTRHAGRLLGAYSHSGQLVAAVSFVWDRHSMYYLLSSRAKLAHPGSVSLLLWHGIQDALQRGIIFDFDGIASPGVLRFLSSFGGVLVPRIGIERLKPSYSVARHIRDLSVMARRTIRPSIESC